LFVTEKPNEAATELMSWSHVRSLSFAPRVPLTAKETPLEGETKMCLGSWLFRSLMMVCLGLALFARSDAESRPKTAHVTIPFDFWVQNSKLPAGAYEISHISSPTVVVFTSSDAKSSTEVFMLPVNNDPVKEGESKLVFSVRNGERYFYELWCIYGRRIATAQYGKEAPRAENRVEVPIAYQ
jgi:hypothetical protein